MHRTFPDHKGFVQSEKKSKETLFRVLGAFALHQPTIGYCQSLNFVAAFFLIIFDYNEVIFKKIEKLIFGKITYFILLRRQHFPYWNLWLIMY